MTELTEAETKLSLAQTDRNRFHRRAQRAEVALEHMRINDPNGEFPLHPDEEK